MSLNDHQIKDWAIDWYCIRAKPRQEMVASATLSTLEEVEVFLPRTQRARKAISGPLKPLFPGISLPVLTQLNTLEMFIMPVGWPTL